MLTVYAAFPPTFDVFEERPSVIKGEIPHPFLSYRLLVEEIVYLAVKFYVQFPIN
mgnify:CR=1 FL=1